MVSLTPLKDISVNRYMESTPLVATECPLLFYLNLNNLHKVMRNGNNKFYLYKVKKKKSMCLVGQHITTPYPYLQVIFTAPALLLLAVALLSGAHAGIAPLGRSDDTTRLDRRNLVCHELQG